MSESITLSHGEAPTSLEMTDLTPENKHQNLQNTENNAIISSSQPTGPVSSSISEPPPLGPSLPPEEETQYPKRKNVFLIMLGLYLATFLIALDRTIIATAVPVITSDFNSLGDIGWYAGAYLLTNCSLVLVFGRIYTFYNPKWVYMTCIFVFEVGSAICGAAPNSTVLILGRAISGLGSSGIFSGGIIIMVHIIPLHKRPLYMGTLASMWGIASSVGPLLGGVLTTKASWRWCFYINLPIGAITIIAIGFLVTIPSNSGPKLSFLQKLAKLDPLGTICFLPGTVCLLLALQLGGVTYAWSDARIIAALVVFGILIVIFIIIEILKQDTALVPPRIISQRSVACGTWYAFWVGSSMLTLTYYLPTWFQAIQGVNAVQSGIHVLPMVLSLNLFAFFTGYLVRRIGYSAPFMLLGSLLMAVGTGLITTWKVDTSAAKWIGYQVIYGVGTGFGLEQASVVAQTVLTKKDIPIGASCVVFFQSLGGAIFTSVGQNVLANSLASSLNKIPGLSLDPSTIVNSGATNLRDLVDASYLQAVLVAYNGALVKVFYVAVASVCMTVFGAVGVEWVSIKRGKPVNTNTSLAERADNIEKVEPVVIKNDETKNAAS